VHFKLQADPTKKSRSEDSIIAYLWRTFMDNKDVSPEILPRYPMTKVSNTTFL